MKIFYVRWVFFVWCGVFVVVFVCLCVDFCEYDFVSVFTYVLFCVCVAGICVCVILLCLCVCGVCFYVSLWFCVCV